MFFPKSIIHLILFLFIISGSLSLAEDYSDSDITKVVMLGSGNPFPDPERSGPSVAIIVNDVPYLFDAGAGVWQATGAATPKYGGTVKALESGNISKVFITHLHSDHVVGLPSLILLPWALGREAPLEVWGPPGTDNMVKHLTEAYREDVGSRKYGLGQDNDTGWRAVGHNVPKAGLVYQDENVKIEAYRTLHTTIPISYAYRVTTPDKVVTISGDTVKNKGIIEASRGADILVHEVVTIEGQDTAGWANGGKENRHNFGNIIGYYHANTKDLAEIANEAKPKLLVLYHVQNYTSPLRPEAPVEEIKKYGYDGKVILSQDQDIY